MVINALLNRILVIFIISAALIAISAITTFANNGPHRGPGYALSTGTCASCHRAHTGTQSKLLKTGENVVDLCKSCHDGLGARTNVLSGQLEIHNIDASQDPNPQCLYCHSNNGSDTQYTGMAIPDLLNSSGTGLNGGGFLTAVPYTGVSLRKGAPEAITSRHNLAGFSSDGLGPWTAWGGGTEGPGTNVALTCIACHNPHGSRNDDNNDGTIVSTESERYRILKNEVNGQPVGPIRGLDDFNPIVPGGTKRYTVEKFKSGIADFCSACHTQYVNASSVYDAGDGQGSVTRFRHPINVAIGATKINNLNTHITLPLEYNNDTGATDKITCLTCHQSHGTSAQMSANATVVPTNDSALLRLNNRGVCQDCHQK